MQTVPGLDKNFRLLLLEVTKQVEDTQEVLERPDPLLREQIRRRDDYIDILKNVIDNTCFKHIRRLPDLPERTLHLIRAVDTVANNLERIADNCESMADQVQYFRDPAFLARFPRDRWFGTILDALGLSLRALAERDTGLAVQICRSEEVLDGFYKEIFQQILAGLRAGEDPGELLTCLMIFHYLERIGDALQNVGEAALFAARGEKLKIRQYESLEKSLASPGVQAGMAEVDVSAPWATRSGVRIGKVQERREAGPELIFKGGNPDKLLKEKAGIERWEQVMPGLTPKILEFSQVEGEATLLLSFLDGFTLQELLLGPNPTLAEAAQRALAEVLRDLWTRTRTAGPAAAGFVRQLKERLEDVLVVHPRFRPRPVQIGSFRPPHLTELLEQAQACEAELPAPFAVLIHGDFNLDNVIYDPRTGRVHFIDVYRSRESDYVQDASVHLASMFRLPAFGAESRAGLLRAMRSFLGFVCGFAAAAGDPTFAARLTLALARALFTATRFEFDAGFANAMRMRADYLLRLVVAHRGRPWSDFAFPEQVFHYWRKEPRR